MTRSLLQLLIIKSGVSRCKGQNVSLFVHVPDVIFLGCFSFSTHCGQCCIVTTYASWSSDNMRIAYYGLQFSVVMVHVVVNVMWINAGYVIRNRWL